MWKDIKKILINKNLKMMIQLGTPVGIAILQSLETEIYYIIIVGIIYVVMIFFYAKTEKSINDEIDEIKGQLSTSEELNNLTMRQIEVYKKKEKASAVTVATYSEVLESYALRLKDITDSFPVKGKTAIRDWDESNLLLEICRTCAASIKKLTGYDDGINVGYIAYTSERATKKKIKKYVEMVAHNMNAVESPDILGRREEVKKCKYHYARLIENGINDIVVYSTLEEIQSVFKRIDGHSTLEKYSQYIAIPVICPASKNSEKKLMGVLQILILNNQKICDSNEELTKFARNSVSQFATLILLVHKIKKILIASVEYKVKENNNDE